MPGLDQHLNDPEYANWVKNTLALKITLGVLKPFVNRELPAIQRSITDKCSSVAVCSSCNVSQAPCCPNNVCNVYRQEIIDNHRKRKPSFANTNAKKWKTDSWEIAKCFMPSLPGYRNCMPSDADFSGVINIIINCKHFDALVKCDLNQDMNVFCKARTMRNDLMHSDSLKVSKVELQKNLGLLISILKCFEDRPPNSFEALEQIKKLMTGELQIAPNDVLDARKQALLAIVEDIDKGKKEIKDFVDRCIATLRQEIERATPISTVPQHRLIGNFIRGCKHSLIRLVASEYESVKPERYQTHEWNFKKFLDKIELFQDIQSLPDRHKRLLYPEDGSPSDINKWDLFLLCNILSLETSAEQPNHLVNYVRELKATRDKILDNLDSISEKDLEMLSGFLPEPLRTEIKSILAVEDITDDVPQLQSVLKIWQLNEDIMECKQVGIKALQETKLQAKRIDGLEIKQTEDRGRIDDLSEKMNTWHVENKIQVDELREDLRRLISCGNMAEGSGNRIEACAEISVRNCDPEEEELVQSNITSEDMDENVACAGGGLNQFQKQMNLETAQTVKGSIILKVTCKSIKELVQFWDSCMDGRAVKALSKIRDDYRKFLGCCTLDFDIVLTKKEVHRCINHLVDRVSSQTLDERILKEIEAKVAMLQTVPAKGDDLSKEIVKPKLTEDIEPEIPYTSAVEGGEEVGLTSLEDPKTPERTEGSENITGNTKRPSLDVHRQRLSYLDTLKKDAMYSEEDATRLTKFLEEIAEHVEEGKISVIKPYLQKMIKHSKDRDGEAFKEDIMDFTEAIEFRSGITVHLMNQALRGFKMIFNEPEFGDLLAAKVEAIEKEEELIGREDTKAWLMDPKNPAIIAEDMRVGDKVAKDLSRTSGTLYGKRFEPAGPSKQIFGYETMKEEQGKFSSDPSFEVGLKLGQTHTQKTGLPTSMMEEKTKSLEQTSSIRKPGPVEATETLPKS